MKQLFKAALLSFGIGIMALAGVINASAQGFLTNGLVAYYPFDGNANDATGNGNNGTLLGKVNFGTDRYGNANSCLSLAEAFSTSNAVDVPSLGNFQFAPATYSIWAFLTNYPTPMSYSVMPVLGRAQCNDQVGGTICIYTQAGFATNQLIYYTGATGFTTHYVPVTNKWIHIVFTLDASNNPTFYINGTSVSGFGSAPSGQPIDFRIGNGDPGVCTTGNYFSWAGSLDDIRIYNRALSSNEVQQLYQYEAPPCNGGGAAATAVVTNGFVVGATVTDPGCGYTNVPPILIQGGGGTGATATAVISNQMLIGITITSTGSGYTNGLPTIYIGGVPTIVSQPQSITTNAYAPATFDVSASGSGMTYQWALNGSNIPGAALPYLYFSNVVQSNLGTYTVTVSNAFGATNSAPAVLAMTPYITIPFGGLETLWGYTNTLDVQSWGSGPLDYQWYDNGVAISGATNSSLTFTDIQTTNSGLYTVVISNQYGSVTNPAEQVVVEPAGIALALFPGVFINGVTGNTYTIQGTTTLDDTNSWVTLTNLTLTQPMQLWVDTNTDASQPFNPKRFYRVLTGP